MRSVQTQAGYRKTAVSDRVNAKYYASGKSSVQCAQLHMHCGKLGKKFCNENTQIYV
jgi:hypothetical protein